MAYRTPPPAPPGNKYAVGNRGGGRKSAYAERADADLLWKLFSEPHTIAAAVARVKSGEYSLCDKVVEMAFNGNEKLLSMFVAKLFPDLVKAEITRAPKLVDAKKYVHGEHRGELTAEVPGPEVAH